MRALALAAALLAVCGLVLSGRAQWGAHSDADALHERHLQLPIDGAHVASWKGAFAEMRGGHAHEAVDIPAPRNTPIHAVDWGTIAKLFVSKAGGLTVYQRDPSARFTYYYAHLERYAGIREGQRVSRGDILGYVGTSGDAPPNAPHLHFAILRVKDPKRWWEGTPLDPYLAYAPAGAEAYPNAR